MITRKIIVRLIVGFLLTACGAFASEPASERGIGIEGDVKITLNRSDYLPKALDDRTPLILRIEEITPSSDGRFVYDFHYIGFESGPHRLSDYLVNPDGSPAMEVGELTVNVMSILPQDHTGKLNSYVPRVIPWFGGYRVMMMVLGVLWILGLLAFLWFGRRKKSEIVVTEELPPPSYAERMQPLVESAASGELSASGQAELERLMTGYWREKLSLPEQRMAESLAAIKRNPEAGALLLALERWLHRPGGASHQEIAGLLEPYRHMTVAPEEAGS